MRRGRFAYFFNENRRGGGEELMKEILGAAGAAIDAQAGVMAKVDDATRALDAARQVQ
jgi:hypothetical protein